MSCHLCAKHSCNCWEICNMEETETKRKKVPGTSNENFVLIFRLLSHLISASHRLIKPYVPTIAQVLLPNLREDSTHVSSYVLSALGELASAGGQEMRENLTILLPLII